jgi:hypothetical protein
MDFPNKPQLVKSAQKSLNIKEDGIAGKATWAAIFDFFGADSISGIQEFLGLTADGIDGPRTWQGIVEKLGVKIPMPSLTPASGKYPERIKLSSQTNGQYAQAIVPKAIVIHDTAGNYEGSIDWTSRIYTPDGKRLYASYHCIIKRNGERTITNLDNNRAYHAGSSFFKGKSSLNSWSIGVAFERDSHTEPLQKEAIESAIEYVLPRMKKWGIAPEYVTDHRTIAPNRKVDLKKEEFEKFHTELTKRWNAS